MTVPLCFIIFISIFFELIRNYVTPIGTKVEEVYKDAYNKTINSVNKDILQFATFLDVYSKEFVLKKEYLKIFSSCLEQAHRTEKFQVPAYVDNCTDLPPDL